MLIIMFSPKFSLFCVAGLLCIFLCAGNSKTKSCMETDKQALLKLKVGFVDEGDILSSWKSEVDCCRWNGISCNNSTGHVIMLDLQPFNYTMQMRGNIDSSLCDLQHLTHLNLGHNDFKGSKIPKCIGSLGQLRELNLSYAVLGGTIPCELQNLSNLKTLDLGGNYDLIANDLEWISNLSSLRHLDLSMVNLSRAIDWQSSLSSNVLSQLRKLILSNTALISVIPLELRNLSNLQTLNLGQNYDLIVNDLEWISKLSSLRHLDLSMVNLSRAIDWQSSLSSILPSLVELYFNDCALPLSNPKSIIHINSSASLKVLSLASNYFDSSILSWVSNVSNVLKDLDLTENYLQHIASDAFANMISLKSLYLLYNSLQHIAPDAFANMISLKSLDLSYNSLQHIAPDAFANSTSLELLSLDQNKLESREVNFISNLCQLKYLSLSDNKLSGQLSNWIPLLSCAQYSIEILDLSDNPFSSGPFPNFSRFSSLVELNLRNASLHGSIPQSFGHLPYLSKLDLSHNNLSGPLLEFVGLSSLTYLDLSNNQLNGTLPCPLRQLPSLVTLQLSSNKLNVVINEAHLSTLSNLQFLDVSHNSISFNFSLNWVPPFQLRGFIASSSKFGPNFPTWLKHQKELQMLEISDGAIVDSIPEWFWLSPSLSYLNLSHNKIYGELPKSLPKFNADVFPGCYIWDLSFNNLSGPLPQFSPSAETLFLSNNMFSGSISSFCETLQTSLTYLDMSNNLLSGRLPDCWGHLRHLEVLDMTHNNFSGTILNSISILEEIKAIHFNNNNLSGKLPAFTNSPNLQLIDFGENNFHGKLPTWIGQDLPNLIVLRLQANKFQGSIPTNLCNLRLLQILDLSHNNITGTIPHCLNNLRALSNLTFPRHTISYQSGGFGTPTIEVDPLVIDNAMLIWKGKYTDYGKNLGLMTAIDLSCNHLEGGIPSSITTLAALASLNLSRNNLTGFIPNTMGQMRMLESLDLSSNSLSGGIPLSFSVLSFLSFLNLSFNNLSGEIPQTTQLQTFDASSYEGNQGLYGPPLTKGYPGDKVFYLDPKSSHNIDGDIINLGFYISMALGFIVGFWGVCGTLFLKSSLR